MTDSRVFPTAPATHLINTSRTVKDYSKSVAIGDRQVMTDQQALSACASVCTAITSMPCIPPLRGALAAGTSARL